jgi:hypothetical protein
LGSNKEETVKWQRSHFISEHLIDSNFS